MLAHEKYGLAVYFTPKDRSFSAKGPYIFTDRIIEAVDRIYLARLFSGARTVYFTCDPKYGKHQEVDQK